MPGMGGSSFTSNNPLVVSLFHHSVFQTSVSWIIAIALVTLVVASVLRRVNTFNLSPGGLGEAAQPNVSAHGVRRHLARRRYLAVPGSMPLAMANGVVAPAAAGTPGWLHALMFDGIGIWNNHPIALAVGTAWIQVGIGLLLLVSNAKIGRLAAAVSVGWAAMIWLVGNGAGGIFQIEQFDPLWLARSVTVLFGRRGVARAADVELSGRFSRYTLRGLSVAVGHRCPLAVSPVAGLLARRQHQRVDRDVVDHDPDAAAARACVDRETFRGLRRHDRRGLQRHRHPLARSVRRGTVDGQRPRPAMADARLRHRLLFFWVVAQDVPFWGGVADGRELVDPARGTGLVREPGARRTPAIAQAPAGRDAIEFRRGRGVLRLGDGPVLRRLDGLGDAARPPRTRCSSLRTVRRRRSTRSARLHADRPVRRDVLDERTRRATTPC